MLTAAAKELRAFGPDDPRVALTLDHLTWAYMAGGTRRKFACAPPRPI